MIQEGFWVHYLKFLSQSYRNTWQQYWKRELSDGIYGEINKMVICKYDCYQSHLEEVFSFVQFSCSVVSNSLRPNGLQHTRLPCPLSTPGVYSNSWPLSWWCHPTISSSVVSFSSCLQSFPASGSFPVSQFFTSGGQSTGVSALTSVLPKNTQD